MLKYRIKVISLKRRSDRRNHIENLFKDIDFDFVDAIDGLNYKLTEEDLKFISGNDYEKYGIHIPSLVCANYTHMNLIRECSYGNIPFFIFEDDVEIIKPIDFSFEEIASKDLDVFWLMPNQPSILAYVVWPNGSKIILDYINRVKLSSGLDWQFHRMKGTNLLKEDQLDDNYFHQIPGKNSDITSLENYGLK
jgi:hypothetical protein